MRRACGRPCAYDALLRGENLTSDWAALVERYRLPRVSLPWINAADEMVQATDDEPPSTALGSESVDIINRLEAPFFAEFGYAPRPTSFSDSVLPPPIRGYSRSMGCCRFHGNISAPSDGIDVEVRTGTDAPRCAALCSANQRCFAVEHLDDPSSHSDQRPRCSLLRWAQTAPAQPLFRRPCDLPGVWTSEHAACYVRSAADVDPDCSGALAYFRLVYPSAAPPTSCAPVEQLLRSSWFLYHTPVDATIVPRVARTLLSPHTHSCNDGFYAKLLARAPEINFAGLLPCGPSARECVKAAVGFRPAWSGPLQRWVETWHLGYNSKRPLSGVRVPASRATDTGASPFWYRFAPGSGIWYDCGQRTLNAHTKIDALIQLVGEWHARRAEPQVGRLNQSLRSPTSKLRYLADEGLAARLRRLGTGDATCREVGIQGCRNDYWLQDQWDVALIQLGRALGYDTIFLATEFILNSDSRGRMVAFATAQLVDLRMPSTLLQPNFLPLWQSGGKRADQPSDRVAASLLDWMAASGRLTLRDPLDLSNEGRARPCRLKWSRIRFHCVGHVSERAAEEPKRSARCHRAQPHWRVAEGG